MKFKYLILGLLTASFSVVIGVSAALAELARVDVEALNVRSGPGTNFGITYVLQEGDLVEVIRRSGDWAFVVGERGGEGWVYAPFLIPTTSGGTPPQPESPGQNFQSSGRIENARFSGRGTGSVRLGTLDNSRSGTVNILSGGFNVTYYGTIRSNFEGIAQIQVDRFQSSEINFHTLPASGTCQVNISGGGLRAVSCAVSGSGIDHGRTNFTAG
ncbi:SH3 domain-containing protein [Microcoleus sp. FACHB-1515]|uniref:SH3 domain-containing protein n=1 Tax=Cyanophyceae TaxID=3028117 RepID=UPI00168A23C9|nr:SH3 domain-containing protein [Microcoleus sp. FACHB-1515]MBD2090226.1 SH3 domain-containing protein [Microcoleus sp. FACHB-1515]